MRIVNSTAIDQKKIPYSDFLRICIDAPFWWMVCVALATRTLYQPITSAQDIFIFGIAHAVFYRALYALVISRFSPWQLALLWLGSPLLLFSATWLRPIWAIIFTSCWAFALWWSMQQQSLQEKNVSNNGLVGYLVVLAWVSVCGAGGYGYQTSDYVMHNGRLLDLINYSWPVSYTRPDGNVSILVQYAGYYLWPALVGKIAGVPVAMFAQHLWLLAGCWLALRMLVILTNVRTWIAALGLLLFGGWDVVAQWLFESVKHSNVLIYFDTQNIEQYSFHTWLITPTMLDFWPTTELMQGIWFGNFVSLSASLMWAPHQIVAGWLVVGLLCHACYQQKIMTSLLACALLAYYAPMIALGLLPMVLVLVVWQWANTGWRREDVFLTMVGISVLSVLGIYYVSVSVGNQPYGVLPIIKMDKFIFLIFLLKSWLLYAVFIFLYRHWLDKKMRFFSGAIFFSAVILPCVYYGVYNDFMVRSSSAVYFGMLLLVLAIFHNLWASGLHWRAALLIVLLLPGIFSGISNVLVATTHADVRVAGKSIANYIGGWQFMGREDSWFVRYLSAELQTQK